MPSDERIADRINIKYVPATGDAKEQRDLPFKVLVTGDFSGGKNKDKIGERKALDINKENFEERLRAQDLSVSTSVPDRLSGEEGAQMKVDLKIRSMRDFRPDAVAEQVDPLRRLVELRKALEDLKTSFINEEEFRNRLKRVVQDPELARAILAHLQLNETK